MRPTQKEIAKTLGISPTAVSLVLNGRQNRISAEKQKQIMELAEDCRIKNKMESGHSLRIGLIVPDISNSFFAEIVEGVSESVRTAGAVLQLYTTDGTADADRSAIGSMKAAKVSALLITASEDCKTDLFSALQCPVIQVDRQSPALQLSSVVLNNKKGGFLATRHLLEQGHRQIAYLSGPPNLVSARERYEGYLWAYREAALKAPEDAVFHGDYLFQSGYRAADAIWSGGFTAVACGNDLMAYGLIKRFRELGLDLPAKMSIVGFDDLSYSELISPALTTVAQSGHAIGYQACKIAFQEIENPHAHHQTILLEPELIIRDSTAVWRKEE